MTTLCAVAYVLRLDDLKQQHATATLAAVLARANGVDATVTEWEQVRADFDAALAAPPEHLTADPAQYELMQALGLR